MRIFIFLLLPLTLISKELETCYRIYFWFLPVAESCVTYNLEGETLKIKSWAKTVVVGRLVKKVNNWGEAKMIDFKPKTFSLFQREGTFMRDHFYIFGEKGIKYRIIKYKSGRKKIKEGFYKSPIFLFDPFSTSFLVYIDTPNFDGKTIHMFYDERVQNIYYRTVGGEKVEVYGRMYDTWKVLLVPKVETKGLLKPKGKWFIWVDKETNIPVKLRINFTIGSVTAYLKKLEGDVNFLLEVRNEQIGVLQRASEKGS